jgi:NADH dehydrogenase
MRMNIALTGANGSVGITLLHHLADLRQDIGAVACVRSERAAAALPASPRILPRVVSYEDVGGLAAALSGTDCLVHLAGILIESRASTYRTANIDATRSAVEACGRAGVSRIVLISVLGADRRSRNRYLSSKGEAERLVAESGIASTIIRTPILLGPGTAGGRSLVRTASQRSARLLGGGRHTIRPLDVDDLSRAILNCCVMPGTDVAVHEMAGPQPISYRELVLMTARLMGRGGVSTRSMPLWLAKAGATVTSWIRRGGMNATVIDVITSNESVRRNAAVDLGVSLTPLETTIEKLLHPAATHASRR